MKRTALVLVLALATTATANPAPPSPSPSLKETRRVIAVLDIHVEGVPSEMAQQFQNSLEAQLDSKRYWLATRAKVRERMMLSTRWTDGCNVGKCLLDVKTQTGAELVLLAALSGSGTSFGYVVTLMRSDVGEVVTQMSDRCDVCTLNEVMTNATLATIQLINAVPDQLPDREAERHAAVALAIKPLTTDLGALRQTKRRAGLALTIAGLVATGLGAALYFNHDKPAYLAIAAGGAGIVVGGLTVLTF